MEAFSWGREMGRMERPLIFPSPHGSTQGADSSEVSCRILGLWEQPIGTLVEKEKPNSWSNDSDLLPF